MVVVAVDVGGGRFMVGPLLAVVVVVDRTWERFGGLGLFWVTQPLPSRVGTLLHNPLAPMAQRLSM